MFSVVVIEIKLDMNVLKDTTTFSFIVSGRKVCHREVIFLLTGNHDIIPRKCVFFFGTVLFNRGGGGIE